MSCEPENSHVHRNQHQIARIAAPAEAANYVALWQELFAKPAHPRLRRNLMIPILAYRIQEQAYGGLKPSTRKRLQKLAAELEQNQKVPAAARATA